jgi:hypothetical protein
MHRPRDRGLLPSAEEMASVLLVIKKVIIPRQNAR